MNRRKFVGLAAGAAFASKTGVLWAAATKNTEAAANGTDALLKLDTFDYIGVRLLPGPFADRLAGTRAFYLSIPDDDILKGFREKAGLPSPGTHLGGWCSSSSALLFGQWLSGMARIYGATRDTEMRAKAVRLMTEWGKTLPKADYGHYEYDKFVCGLVDMEQYGVSPDALPLLARLTDWAEGHLSRTRQPASDDNTQGDPMEWYTLSENLYRAYFVTGDERYRKFGDVWRYDYYWGMFNGKNPATPDGFHAYSHVNALSSAAMTYAITGDSDYLRSITGAYDFFQKTQCYATGGYGPGEKLMRPDGELGRSIVVEPNAKYLAGAIGRSFETPCGTWAVFKLGHYLQQFTGAARYGDWTERVLYNGIGAALPMRGRGQTFYYADYRLNGATKHYFGEAFPCCAGTYIQDVAAIHNILYYYDRGGLFINLYVPSEVTWNQGDQKIKLSQVTTYPESEDVNMTLQMAHPTTFSLSLRIPQWAKGVSVRINDRAQTVAATPGQWLKLDRKWKSGDRVTLHIPLSTRTVPIDEQHPHRIAYARGPVVLVQPQNGAAGGKNTDPTAGMIPFSQVGENEHYAMYFDPPTVEVELVPTSLQNGALWSWTTRKPADDWSKPAFDATAWKRNPAPFGTMPIAHTRWDSPDIWIRRQVTIPPGEVVDPQLRIFWDEDAEVYFNGVPAAHTTSFSTAYELIELSAAAKALVRPGAQITIAVHVHQTVGSQLIDLGIVDLRLQSGLGHEAA